MEKQVLFEIDQAAREHWWFRGRRLIIGHILKQFTKIRGKFTRALDVGCGPGVNLDFIKKFARQVYGLDNSENAIELARRRSKSLSILKGEFLSYEGKAKYDLLTLFDVLEHIKDDCRAFIKIDNLLIPGGIALLTVPAFHFLWTTHDDRLRHYRRYTINELRAKIENCADLQIEKITYFNSFLFLPIIVFRLFKKMFGLDYKSDFFMPPKPINFIFLSLLLLEANLIKCINLPFGVSILCVLKKK